MARFRKLTGPELSALIAPLSPERADYYRIRHQDGWIKTNGIGVFEFDSHDPAEVPEYLRPLPDDSPSKFVRVSQALYAEASCDHCARELKTVVLGMDVETRFWTEREPLHTDNRESRYCTKRCALAADKIESGVS